MKVNKNDKLVILVYAHLKMLHMTMKQLGQKLALKPWSIYHRMDGDQDFRLDELRIIFKTLHFSDAEILEAIKG